MADYIERIEATGVYGRFDISQEFNAGVNIIYGKNGAGKTTLLHILANAASGDFDRFTQLLFNTIKIWFSGGRMLQITGQKKEKNSPIEVLLNGEKISPDIYPQEEIVMFNEHLRKQIILLEQRRTQTQSLEQEKELMELTSVYHDQLERLDSARRFSKDKIIIPIAYFPAFRTMIEAWIVGSSQKLENSPRGRFRTDSWKDLATDRAREWFGGFTPMINFPSLLDIEEHLSNEIERARMSVWRTDQTLISEAFQKIFSSLSETKDTGEKVETILEDIQNLFDELEKSPLRSESKINLSLLRRQIANLNIGGNTDNTAVRVLRIYRDTLQRTLNVQRSSFEGIEKYLSSVNGFFDDKYLIFKPDIPAGKKQSIQIQFFDGSLSNSLRTLSSGERQIMTLVYAATHMSEQQIVLIDEPEISLHIDWQRELIRRMAEQMGQRQIIACTHSPVIGADHLGRMKELSLSPTKVDYPAPVQDADEEEAPF